MQSKLDDALGMRLDAVYEESHASLSNLERLSQYHRRHETRSLAIVTVGDCGEAEEILDWLTPQIEGKTVVEIGAGVGLLAWYMAKVAASVTAIEVDPAWVSVFVDLLYDRKPRNLTWVFGDAEQVAGYIRADVAVFCTYSAEAWFREVASRMAPTVIDVRREFKTSKVLGFENLYQGLTKERAEEGRG